MAPTKDIRRYDDLPPNAKSYISRITEIVETPAAYISVGSDREQTITV